MTLSTGTKLGRYEIRPKIGADGMGEQSNSRAWETVNRYGAYWSE